MDLDRNELKNRAREAMRLTNPSFWLVALVYLLITTGVTSLIGLIPADTTNAGTFSLFLSILLSLYTVVIDFGFVLWSLWTYRRLDPGMDSLIQGFSVSGRVIYMQLLIFVRLLGWTFVFSFAATFLAILVTDDIFAAAMVSMVVTYLVMYVVSLRYKLADYLLADFPDLGPAVAIHRSVQLMQGWKLEWFKLDLSFLGWSILGFVLEAVAFFAAHILGGTDLSAFSTALAQMDISVLYPASTLVTVLATLLITIPLQLWLLPYRGVTFAGFYDARVQLAASSNMTDPFGPIAPV